MIGSLFIIAAPSGAGKTSLVNALLEKIDQIKVSISHTTRPSRPGEQDGVNYFFVSHDEFQQMVEQDVFLEHAQVFGQRYGTSKQWVVEQLQQGQDVILEIDWQGARQIRKQLPEAIGIFILPPSKQALQERLTTRAQDDAEVIAYRMAQANEEISHHDEYDYLVINDNFQQALIELETIIKATRLRNQAQVSNNKSLIDELLA